MKVHRIVGMILIGFGLLTLLFSFGAFATVPTASAQSLPERPTLTPIPETKGSKKTEEATSRITGTVIDRSIGAPAPGIQVVVGDTTVTTDANGNYDRSGLPAGDYDVYLIVPAGRGPAAQGTIWVALGTADTKIVHLAFGTPAVATPEPTAIPVPAELPRTGGTDFPIGLLMLGMLLVIAGAGLSWSAKRS